MSATSTSADLMRGMSSPSVSMAKKPRGRTTWLGPLGDTCTSHDVFVNLGVFRVCLGMDIGYRTGDPSLSKLDQALAQETSPSPSVSNPAGPRTFHIIDSALRSCLCANHHKAPSSAGPKFASRASMSHGDRRFINVVCDVVRNICVCGLATD